MKDIIENIFGFLYTLSMGDYIFLIATFIIILAFVYVLYLIKRDEEMGILYKNEDISYLENVKETLEKDYKPNNIDLTDYEKEQEESAIISYEELIKNKDKINISYDKNYKSETEESLKLTPTPSTILDKILLDLPGILFCSCIKVLIPNLCAASITG